MAVAVTTAAAATTTTAGHDFARIDADAHSVDTGHGHRVCGARAVPVVQHVVAAGSAVRWARRPGRGGPCVNGPIQSSNRRRRASVQGPADGHHAANCPVRGVQRRVRRSCRIRHRLHRHRVRDYTHV